MFLFARMYLGFHFPRPRDMITVFFPFCINNWNNLDNTIKFLPTVSQFKSNLNKFVCPKGNNFYAIRDSVGIKLLTKIRVTFCDLRDHRYNHNFNCENPICSYGLDDETAVRFFLCYHRYNNLRTTYLCKISDIIGSDVTVLPNDHLTNILMCGSNIYNDVSNELILIETMHFIKKTGRFQKFEAFC